MRNLRGDGKPDKDSAQATTSTTHVVAAITDAKSDLFTPLKNRFSLAVSTSSLDVDA